MAYRQRLVVLAAAAALVGTGAAAPLEAAGSVRTAGHPSLGAANQVLNAVDEIAPDDVWAVGTRSDFAPFMRHWDGTQWRPFVGPSKMRSLQDVDHSSSTDVWAVGHGGVIHWDGSAWRMSYNAPGGATVLLSVVAISEDDVWAVGYDKRFSSVRLHWDGSTWTQVGDSEPDTQLRSVDADRSDDVWAVGIEGEVERWDGTSWTRLSDAPSSAYAVAVASPEDVWIAGGFATAWMSHWNGHRLVPVDIPTPGVQSGLNDLGVVSATDIWAVGATTPAGHKRRSLVEHWDGRHWHLRPVPDLKYAHSLYGVDVATSDDAYAVGSIRDHRFHGSSLTMHWDGTGWTRLP